MIERGQEPYISDEMKKIMELAEFEVVHCVKKDTYLGKKKKKIHFLPRLFFSYILFMYRSTRST